MACLTGVLNSYNQFKNQTDYKAILYGSRR